MDPSQYKNKTVGLCFLALLFAVAIEAQAEFFVPAPHNFAFMRTTPLKPCKTAATNGVLKNLQVVPCEGKDRCSLVRGTNVTLVAEFVTQTSTKTLFGSLAGVKGWIKLPFGASEDLCQNPDIKCPTEPNQVIRYERTIFVRTTYPSWELDVNVRVTGDSSGDIVCALIPVKITG